MNKLGTVDHVNSENDNLDLSSPQIVKHDLKTGETEIIEHTIQKEFNLTDVQTEIVELPSKGLLYSPDSPLHKGVIEIKYMTAKEEDILSTQSYIKQGIVLDKLCESIIATKGVKFNDLIIGDKNAVLFAARAYGYGPTYQTVVKSNDGTEIPIAINLEELPYTEIDESLITPGVNKFSYTLPRSKKVVEFKLLTVGDQKKIDDAIKNMKKMGPNYPVQNLTQRLKYMILSVDGNTDKGIINTFIDNMLAVDSRAFREYVAKIQPDVNLEVEVEDPNTGEPFRSSFEIGVDLFYPDYKK